MAISPELVDRFAAAAEIIREREQLRTYECDRLTGRRVVPSLVALPTSAAEVQVVVRLCNEAGIPFVACRHTEVLRKCD
jgi:FAD/FMN-containing dehydrogenase